MDTLSLQELHDAIAGDAAAFRCRRRLQPGGGAGDKVFPPTFAGSVYATEKRRIPGQEKAVDCVLLDSVQSQANRMELALQEATNSGHIKLPILEVDFTEHDPTGDLESDKESGRLIDSIGKITSLQVPHRLADAILRDSELDGEPFRKSQKGKQISRASLSNATPIFELCPTALLFGMWDSTGPNGALGAKFERAIVSEVVGLGAEIHEDHRNRGVRRDPLGIRKTVKVIKESADKPWKVADAGSKSTTKPSKILHSNILFESNGGTTIEYAEQITTLSLICLRNLRFPIGNQASPSADVAARTLLAALGLCAATLAFESGMNLRSRCLLWPDNCMEWELLQKPSETPKQFSLTKEEAIKLFNDSVNKVAEENLPWLDEPLTLQPSEELLKLVRQSQELAIQESVGQEA